MRRSGRQPGWIVAAGAVVVLAVVGAALWTGRGGADPAGDATSPCGAHPFEHVYHPSRLKVLAKCRTVTGTIDFIRREPDGDLHIRLHADDASLLNQKNIDEQHGDLVIEPVCVHDVTQEDAKDACRGYQSDIAVPDIGTRVSVTGPWVLDKPHGWNEIHPIVEIAALP
jgi:hypothetical protein